MITPCLLRCSLSKLESEDLELTRTIGTLALKYMAKHEIAFTPDNYAVWYMYASGQNEALSLEIERLVAKAEPFRRHVMADFYARYASRTEDSAKLDEAGAKVQAEVARVLAMVSEAEQDAKAYGDSLNSAKSELGVPSPPLSSIVTNLVQSTREMLEKNQRLEESLHVFTSEVAGLRENLAKARQEANTDALTQLHNRKAFEDDLKASTAIASLHDQPLSLLFCDVDHFKTFNDQFGHALGDQVLRIVAKGFVDNMPARALAARFGGDEFAVLLPDTDLTAAILMAERARKAIEGRKIIKRNTGEQLGRITTSMGVSEYIPGEAVTHFVARADGALYAAKAAGRNRVATQNDIKENKLQAASLSANES